MDQCGSFQFSNALPFFLISCIAVEKEVAFFAAEFAQQQKEAEQQRRAKQTEKDTAKKEKKNVSANISILSTLR